VCVVNRHGWRGLAVAVVPVVVLFGGALLGALRTSLQPAPGPVFGAADLGAWRDVLADPTFHDALLFTGRLTVVATLLSAVLAVAAASVLRRRRLVQVVFSLPVLVPHLLAAVLAALWLGAGGLVDRALGDLPVVLVRDRAGWGVVLVYLFKEVPFLALLVLSAWGPATEDRAEAAATLGAGRVARLRFVVWPAIRAPLLLGSVIVAAYVFGAFEVPLVVGPSYPPTVATYALDATRTASLVGQARAAAALLVAAGVSLVVAVVALAGVRREL
jgi:putative spermidine/putrescine transport system permease protein